MANWPDAAALKRRLGIGGSSSGVDEDLALALDAAIEQVKLDTGADWDADSGVPEVTSSLAAAALLLAMATYKAPDAPHGIAAVFDIGSIMVARDDPRYWRLLVGQRERFGIA